MPPPPQLHVEQADDVTVVRFRTSRVLGEGPCQAAGKQLFGLVDEEGRRKLVLDITGVERLDSALVAKLVWLDKRLKAAGGRLTGNALQGLGRPSSCAR